MARPVEFSSNDDYCLGLPPGGPDREEPLKQEPGMLHVDDDVSTNSDVDSRVDYAVNTNPSKRKMTFEPPDLPNNAQESKRQDEKVTENNDPILDRNFRKQEQEKQHREATTNKDEAPSSKKRDEVTIIDLSEPVFVPDHPRGVLPLPPRRIAHMLECIYLCLGDLKMYITDCCSPESRKYPSTLGKQSFQSRKPLCNRFLIILCLLECLSLCSAEKKSCTLPDNTHNFESVPEVRNSSEMSEDYLHLNHSTCAELKKTSVYSSNNTLSDWCRKIFTEMQHLDQSENHEKLEKKTKTAQQHCNYQKIHRDMLFHTRCSESFKTAFNTKSNTVWAHLDSMELMQSHFVHQVSAMDSGKPYVFVSMILLLVSASWMYCSKKVLKEIYLCLMIWNPFLKICEPSEIKVSQKSLGDAISSEMNYENMCKWENHKLKPEEKMGATEQDKDGEKSQGSLLSNDDTSSNTTINGFQPESIQGCELNVLDLKTQTMEKVDGSLDIRKELDLQRDCTTYKELDIHIRTEESDKRTFTPNSEEVLGNQTASLLPEANLLQVIVMAVVVETTNKSVLQETFVKTKKQSLQEVEEDYPYIPTLMNIYNIEVSTIIKDINGSELTNPLLDKTAAPSQATTPPPVLNEPTASSSKEVPPTEVKNLRMNVVPTPSFSGRQQLPLPGRHQSKKHSQRPWPYEEKKEKAAIRDTTWLSLDQLPRPKLDNIPVNYSYDRFEPLSLIISQIAEGKSPRPQVTMRYELLRLCTLRTYPKDNKPFMMRYAAAGFYYASDGDGVVCYCCGIRRYGWVEADDPMEVHKRINPRCKFIINNGEHNVPAMAEGPLRQNVSRLDMIPDCVLVPSTGEDVNNSQRTRLGVQMAIPKHAHMAIKTVREQSFNGNWPNTPKYSPVQLADGGFFFTGLGDCVRCFFCGIGLRHWDKEDDMWVEHARWSQYCTFLIQKKGQNFVDLVQLAVEQLDDSDQSANTLYKNLVSEAAQNILDQSEYTPQQIKNAIVAMLTLDSNTIVTVWKLKQKVAELIQESETNIKHGDELGNATEPLIRNSVGENELSNIAPLDPAGIQQENEQLKEQTLCKVCLDNIVSIVFLPCGHLVTCADCAPALRKCPICRADVKGTVRTRMS